MRRQIGIFVAGFVATMAGGVLAQTIPEIARTKPKNPIVRGVLRDITTVPLETLSKEATLIVIGRLVFTRSYLTPDEMNILSDYAVHAERVLAGDPQVTQRVPGASVAPTLTVYGGELTVDGMTVSAVDHNLNLPASGQTYLMFLKRFGPDAGRYQTVRGALFAVEPNERLSSLLKRADMAIPYKDIVSRSLSEAVIEIARARR